MNTEKFKNLFEFKKKSKIKAGEGLEKGKYAFFTSSSKQSKYLNKFLFDEESLIFGTGGKASIHYCDNKFAVSTDCLVAYKKYEFELNTKYVYYYLHKNINILKKGFKGAGLKHISKDYIVNIDIPRIALGIQNNIVKVLDKAKNIQGMRNQSNKLIDEFQKSVFIEMFGDPIRNPKGWTVDKFGKVGVLDRGKSKHRPRNAPELYGGPYPFIQTGDVANADTYITNYHQMYSEIGLQQSKMWNKGTLCITIAANIAKSGILTFDSCFPDSIVGFIPNNNMRIEYVIFWLSFIQKSLEESAPESAQKNINLKILKNINIPLPPMPLQEKFADIVNRTEQLKQKQKESEKEINNLFNSLMQKSFSGELFQ